MPAQQGALAAQPRQREGGEHDHRQGPAEEVTPAQAFGRLLEVDGGGLEDRGRRGVAHRMAGDAVEAAVRAPAVRVIAPVARLEVVVVHDPAQGQHLVRALADDLEALIVDLALELQLAHVGPLAWEAMLGYLRGRAFAGLETMDAGIYRRAFVIGGRPGYVEVSPVRSGTALRLAVRTPAVDAMFTKLPPPCRRNCGIAAMPAR